MEAPWVVDALWKVTALFALGAAGASALRRSSARTRYFLWAGVLASAALLPGLGAWMPRVHVPLWTWSAPVELRAAQSASPAIPAASRASEVVPEVRVTSPWSRFVDSPKALATTLWLAGFGLVLARLGLGIRRARALARAARDLDGTPWRSLLAEVRQQLPGLRDVRVCASPDVTSPATFGFLRPVVLLPADATTWSAQRCRMVMMHELVHVARRDWLVQLAGQVVRAVYWFHPLAHFAARRLAWERERACDERVIALGAAPSDYASHLLAVALALPRRPSLSAALAMARPARRAQLEGRLMSILEAKPASRASCSLARILVPALVLSVPALASIQPWTTTVEPHAAHTAAHECACRRSAPAVPKLREKAPRLEYEAARQIETELAAKQLHTALAEAERELAANRSRVAELRMKLEALRGSGVDAAPHRGHDGDKLHLERWYEEATSREQALKSSEQARYRLDRALELQQLQDEVKLHQHEAERALEDQHQHALRRYAPRSDRKLYWLDERARLGDLHDHVKDLELHESSLRARETAQRAYEEARRAHEKALHEKLRGDDALHEAYRQIQAVDSARATEDRATIHAHDGPEDPGQAPAPHDSIEDLLRNLYDAHDAHDSENDRSDAPDGRDAQRRHLGAH